MRTIVLFGSIILFPVFFGIVVWSFASLGSIGGLLILSAYIVMGYLIYRSNRKALDAELENFQKATKLEKISSKCNQTELENFQNVTFEKTNSKCNQAEKIIDEHRGLISWRVKKGFHTEPDGKLVIERETNAVYELQICFIPIFLPFTVFEFYIGGAQNIIAFIGLAILALLFVAIFYKSFVVIDSAQKTITVRKQIRKWVKEKKYLFSDIIEVELFHSCIEGTDSYDVRLRGTTKIRLRGYGKYQENAMQLQSEALKHIQLPESARTLTHWYGLQ